MAKKNREKIKMISSAGTGHYYTTTKNKRNTPDKLKLKKYDPIIRKHILYNELDRIMCSRLFYIGLQIIKVMFLENYWSLNIYLYKKRNK